MLPYRLCILLLAVLMTVVEGAAQLPPDIQADRSLVEAERHIGNGDHAAALAALDRILELQAAHGLALPEAFWFKHAQVAQQAGAHAEAVESVTRYLTTAGREGAHYREALELLDQAMLAAERIAQLPREISNSLGMEFVLIEPGTFEMGSPATESGWDDGEGPVHQVTLSQPFYMGKYEVTQGQWTAIMGSNPSQVRRLWPPLSGRNGVLGRHAGVYRGVEPARGGECVPVADRSGVGVYGTGTRADGGLLV